VRVRMSTLSIETNPYLNAARSTAMEGAMMPYYISAGLVSLRRVLVSRYFCVTRTNALQPYSPLPRSFCWKVCKHKSTTPRVSCSHLADNATNCRLSACGNSVGTPANLTYLRSAASCCCVCLSAAFTAARNESLPTGACTSPDSVSRKETFFP
jgi:hypothetical protein